MFLIGFNVIPANATTTVACSGGGYFTYIGTTVVEQPGPGGTICVGEAIIPDSILTIGEYAFYDTAVTSVIISNSVTTIEGDAFSSTPYLNSITIPNSVTTIGNFAFYQSALTSVTIGNQVATIGSLAFFANTSLTTINFLGNAPSTADDAFSDIGTGATANVVFDATGFTLVDGLWRGLIVSYSLPPAGDSDSSTPKVIKTVAVEAPDAEIKVKNSKSLTKREIKTMLDKKKTFKNYPIDKYKYSIFGTSKKICAINGNYVVALEKTGACEMWVTRTTAKGAKYKYWVKINYLK